MDSYVDCIIRSGVIRECVRTASGRTDSVLELVYERGNIEGYLDTHNLVCDNENFLIISQITMKQNEVEEILVFQYDTDYIEINRTPLQLKEVSDADIFNIVLEIAKEIEKPVMYTNMGKPVYLYKNNDIWRLQSEKI